MCVFKYTRKARKTVTVELGGWTSKARITRDNKEYKGREEADLWGRG